MRARTATISGRFPAALVALASLVLLPACSKGCKNDHPYVPYAVGDAPSSSASTGAGPELTSASDAGAISVEPAQVAQPGMAKWRLEGLELVAPEGSELVSALVRDFDGDGNKDALAIVRRPAPPEKPGEVGPAQIVHYAGTPNGAAPPVFVATAPHPRTDAPCTPLARLERIGPRSALAEVGAVCKSGASSRSLWIVRLTKTPTTSYGLTIADPPGAPKLSIDVEATDRDHDGLDDVGLRVTVEGGSAPFEPGPKLTTKVAFFDRPAGPSRDAEEPEASLRAIAAQATAKAGKVKDSLAVTGLVQQMRSLYRAVCVEGGAPRLLDPSGSGKGAITCGPSKPLEEAGIAEVRSFVFQADALRAIAAADLAQLAPATKTAARTTELKKLLDDVAPATAPLKTKTLTLAVPSARAAHPEWGPLAFEPSGKLLVRTSSNVQRVDPESGEAAEAETPAWPSQVLSSDGKSRWLEAYHACEGVALRATFVPVGDGDMRDVLLPISPPLGTRCANGRGESATTVPLAWSARGLEAIVAGMPVLVRPELGTAAIQAAPTAEQPPYGSPRSPSGRSMALSTKDGILVKSARSIRVKAPELEPYDDLRHCTTTDDASRVACVKKGRVVVIALDRQ